MFVVCLLNLSIYLDAVMHSSHPTDFIDTSQKPTATCPGFLEWKNIFADYLLTGAGFVSFVWNGVKLAKETAEGNLLS